MADTYKITATQPWIYSDVQGRVVHGFKVFLVIPEFNETHELTLPSLDQAMVKAAAEKLVKDRKALASL